MTKMNYKIYKLLPLTRSFCTVPKRQSNVCIVGAGPAGFYAAMHLSKNLPDVYIDIIEKLPVPFGLIRYGVAPDHPEVKNVINQFTKVAQQSNVNFYGNISLGRDINVAQLRQYYDAVLLTYGAEEDKILGIDNENAKNIIAARKFVGWYNGLPEDKNLQVDLSGSMAAVLGQGNVALDVARILLTPVDELRKSDITEHALNALAESKIKEIHLIGRRGPLQVAFTIKELRELLKMNSCKTIWRREDFTGVADTVPNLQRPRKRLTELMLKSLSEMQNDNESKSHKQFKPVFFRSPSKFLVNDTGYLSGIELICTKLVGDKFEEQKCVSTNEKEILDCQLAFRSIGYRSVSVDCNLNFDAHNGVLMNDSGRVLHEQEQDNLGRLYVAGWLGTGPFGVILHTMANSFQVAKMMCEDLKKDSLLPPTPGFAEVKKLLDKNNIQVVDWSGWERIDKYEMEQGKILGKPREKVCSIRKMLEVANIK